MKKLLLSISIIVSGTFANAQTWTKISGRGDSTEVKSLASINGRVIIAGKNWFSNAVTDYLTSTDGYAWNRVPSFSFANPDVWGLTQNNLLLTGSPLNTKTYSSNTWANFNTTNLAYAEFSNGTILCGSYFAVQSLSIVASNGVIGASTGASFRMGLKYCNGSNNRLFMLSNGGGLGYIDYVNLSTIVYPTTLNGAAMTATNWLAYIIFDMIKLNNGDLIGVGGSNLGVIKSTDNGVTWNNLAQFPQTTTGSSIVKNSAGHLFLLAAGTSGGLKVWQSIDNGTVFSDITGNLATPNYIKFLYINAADELFCVVNGNNYQPTTSGIYSFGSTLGINETTHELTGVNVFPNPADSYLNIELSDNMPKATTTITITNILGKEVLKTTEASNNFTLKTNHLKSGVYFVTLANEGKTATKKIIIE